MMLLQGIDIYIQSNGIPDIPKVVGPMSLELMSNRGTRVYPPPAPDIDMLNWFRCRYYSQSEVKSEDVDALIKHITDNGWKWTKCEKLFTLNGVKQFSEPY